MSSEERVIPLSTLRPIWSRLDLRDDQVLGVVVEPLMVEVNYIEVDEHGVRKSNEDGTLVRNTAYLIVDNYK